MSGAIKKTEIIEADLVALAEEIHKVGVEMQTLLDILGKKPPKVEGLSSLKKETEELTFNEAELAKQHQELGKLTAKLENIQTNYNKEIIKTRVEISNQNAITKQQVLQNNSLEGSYDKLNATLNQTIKEYKALSQADRENMAIGGEMIKSIQAQDAKLKQLDATMGKNQRNVGNYKSGFNGLNFSILQVGRELPSLAYGVNVFAGAISNNIPMVTDELKRAREEIIRAKKAGEESTPIWKQVGAAIFSWQTVLVLGLTIFTMYGKEIISFVGKLFKTKSALEQNRIAQERLNEANKKGYENGQKDIVRLRLLYNATQSNTISLNEKKKAIKELQDQYPDYLGKFSEEEILAGKAGKAYYELANAIMASAKAKAYEQIIVENEVKKLELETKVLEERKNLIKSENSLNEARKQFGNISGTEEAMAGASSMISAAQSNVDKFTKSINELNTEISAIEYSSKELADRINPTDLLSNLGQDKNSNLENKKTLAKTELQLAKEKSEKELAEFKRAEQLKLAEQAKASNELIESDDALKAALEEQKYESDQRIIAEEIRLQEELLKLTKEGSTERASVESEIAKIKENFAQSTTDRTVDLVYDEIAARKKALAQQKKDINDASKHLLSDTENNIIKEQTILTEKAREDIKAAKGNAKKTKEIKDNLIQDMLSVELMYRKDVDSNDKLIGDDKQRNLDRIVDVEKNNEEQKFKRSEDVENAIYEVKQQIFAKSAELVNAGFDLIQQGYANQLSIAEQTYESEKEAAGDNLTQRIIAERKFEKEKKRIARNQAIAEKAQAAFSIALSTAQAIIAVWANPLTLVGAPALTALISALGAAQLASVLSQPIPAFADGIEDFKGGLAVLGDGTGNKKGKELVIEPSGKKWLSSDMPSLYNLPKGSDVIPADETSKILANMAFNQVRETLDMAETNKYLSGIEKNTRNNSIFYTDSKGRTVIKRGTVNSIL